MKPRFSDLWRWDGEVDRGAYLMWGALLIAVKFNIDRFVLATWFNTPFNILDYFRATGPAALELVRGTREQQLTMLAIALPFLWAGLVLSLKRLRSLKWPSWMVVLFVTPLLKWFFFASLTILPRCAVQPPPLPGHRAPQWFERLVPRGRFGSAAFGVAVAMALAVGAIALGTGALQQYGWGLFVGVPFVMGLASVLVYGVRERRTIGECLLVAMLSAFLAGLAVIAVAFEGVICLVMAAPLAAGLALIGGLIGYAIQASSWQRDSGRVMCAAVLAVPLALGAERLEDAPAPLLEVRSSLEVNAPPERVWRHVVSFAELPPPTEILFRAGVAYPMRAEIQGRGVGAVRHCVFSTGPFVEPIEVWDEPRQLKFSVTQNPAPMQEWTPYRNVHPPHLDGFLASSGGQFLLTPLPGGRTRLEGTTWYRHHMWPVGYWQAWSDSIIHRIHLRVLNHVKQLAEQPDGVARAKQD
jgi:hypothetical protein